MSEVARTKFLKRSIFSTQNTVTLNRMPNVSRIVPIRATEQHSTIQPSQSTLAEIKSLSGTRHHVQVNLPLSLPKRISRNRVFVTLSRTKNMKLQMSYPFSERSSTTGCWKRLSPAPISRLSISIAYVPATGT